MFAITTMLVLTGCSWTRGTLGDAFDPERLALVKKGSSTRSDVVQALGAPERIIHANGHEIFQYYRYDLKAGSLLLAVVNFSRITIKSDDLYVWFSRDGVVEDMVFGKRSDHSKFRFWPFGD